MLATYKNEGVGLAIAQERGERSFMKEGNGDGKKLISDENRTSYNESNEGGGTTAPLQKEALAFGFLRK
jgi:hypothetical protein